MPVADVRRFETCGRAWIGVLRHVWSAGEAGMADRGPIIEGPPLLFEIASLGWEDPILRKHGDRSRPAGRAEERTVFPPGAPLGAQPGGSPDVRPVPPSGARGDGSSRDSSVGPSGSPRPDADQIRWVVDLLRARPWTTSAWISLTVPGEPADGPSAPAALAFRIRGCRVMMTAMFRAQNVHRAYLAYIPLHEVQTGVAERLGLPSGPFRAFVDVPYLQVADAERVATVLAAQPEPNAA